MSAVTTLRTGTITRILASDALPSNVFDSRTTELEAAEVPAVIVTTQKATTDINGSPETMGTRTQTLDIYVEFSAPASGSLDEADATLAAAADAYDAVLWGVLVGDPDWIALWHRIPTTWVPTFGLKASTDKRRGVLHVAITGELQTAMPDPTDAVYLRKFHASLAADPSEGSPLYVIDSTNPTPDPEA